MIDVTGMGIGSSTHQVAHKPVIHPVQHAAAGAPLIYKSQPVVTPMAIPSGIAIGLPRFMAARVRE
jgi:hypothetical protein